MAKDVSMRAFKCPSCGAPLEPETGTLTMKCPYCGGTVIIPESLRTPPPSSGPTMGQVFDFGLNGLDMNKIVGNAMQLPHAISLAQMGRFDEAADIYSQITGMQHDDAVESVKAMAAGHAVSLTPGRPGMSGQQFQTSWSTPSAQSSTPSTAGVSSFSTTPSTKVKSSGGGTSCGLIFGILAGVTVLIVGLVAAAFFLFPSAGSTFNLIPVSIGFASQKLRFGSEGIGPGMLEDPRRVGVDGNGNIVVADYEDGRVQTFDPTGKFISGFSVSADGKKVYLTGMAVSRDGHIYLVHDQKIFIYDSKGKQVDQIGDDSHDYSEVTIGGDGKLYAVANEETIVRFNSDHSIDLEVPDTFSNVTGDSELDSHLAVDGLGNMYIVGTFNYVVLKYSPQGKFVNQFGGEQKDPTKDEPGKFTSPEAITVDGYGRVFVADFFDIKVFDANGAYLNKINVDGGPFSVVFDGQNNLYTVTSDKTVLKYAIQKPSE